MISIKVYNNNSMQENTFILYDDTSGAVAVIDPGCYPTDMQLHLRNLGRVDYIILTHGHGDHIASVLDIKTDYPDSQIIANEAEREMLTNSEINGSAFIVGHEIQFEADLYVKDNDTCMLGETELRFISTPGHSLGGMCIYAQPDVLFSGDTLFKASIGRSDFYGGDFNTLINSIRTKLLVLPEETTVLPGHGPSTTIAYEKKVNPFV